MAKILRSMFFTIIFAAWVLLASARLHYHGAHSREDIQLNEGKEELPKVMEEDHTTNRLVLYRKRMKFSQKKVARILGLKNVSVLSHYERGTTRPSLERALGLEIIYRVPVAFLFPDLYEGLRSKVRERENRMGGIIQ